MCTFPPDVSANKKTPAFTQCTVPAWLLTDHATKDGVRGVVHVLSSPLQLGSAGYEMVTVLCLGTPGIIEPIQTHHVTPLSMVEFYMEFYL